MGDYLAHYGKKFEDGEISYEQATTIPKQLYELHRDHPKAFVFLQDARDNIGRFNYFVVIMQCFGTLDGFLTGWFNIWNRQEQVDFDNEWEDNWGGELLLENNQWISPKPNRIVFIKAPFKHKTCIVAEGAG